MTYHWKSSAISTTTEGTSLNAHAMPPAEVWSLSGSTPSEAGGCSNVETIGELAIISAMPKNAWKGMPAKSSSIRIT